MARCARHSHPSPPEKKAASRKKSRLRRKKTAPIANSGASSVSRVVYPYLWILATTDPPRLIALGFAISKLRFGFASLAWRKSTIRHLRWQVCPSSPEQKSASLNKNTAYSLQDRIVFIDQWVNCFFVNISKNLVAKLRMACTEGKTNKECCVFWGG